jgi:hypothetical protein
MRLRLTGRSYPNHDSVVVSRPTALGDVWNTIVEIHGSTRQEIALSMLSKYPCRLICWGGLCVEVEAPEEACSVLKQLQSLEKPIRRKDAESVLKNPTLENVRRLVAVRKLLE